LKNGLSPLLLKELNAIWDDLNFPRPLKEEFVDMTRGQGSASIHDFDTDRWTYLKAEQRTGASRKSISQLMRTGRQEDQAQSGICPQELKNLLRLRERLTLFFEYKNQPEDPLNWLAKNAETVGGPENEATIYLRELQASLNNPFTCFTQLEKRAKRDAQAGSNVRNLGAAWVQKILHSAHGAGRLSHDGFDWFSRQVELQGGEGSWQARHLLLMLLIASQQGHDVDFLATGLSPIIKKNGYFISSVFSQPQAEAVENATHQHHDEANPVKLLHETTSKNRIRFSQAWQNRHWTFPELVLPPHQQVVARNLQNFWELAERHRDKLEELDFRKLWFKFVSSLQKAPVKITPLAVIDPANHTGRIVLGSTWALKEFFSFTDLRYFPDLSDLISVKNQSLGLAGATVESAGRVLSAVAESIDDDPRSLKVLQSINTNCYTFGSHRAEDFRDWFQDFQIREKDYKVCCGAISRLAGRPTFFSNNSSVFVDGLSPSMINDLHEAGIPVEKRGRINDSELANILGVAAATVQRWRKEGLI